MGDSKDDLTVLTVSEHGPYVVEGEVELRDAVGEEVSKDGKAFLCRCGQSKNKPFCDGSHNKIDFDGSETADHGPIAGRRRAYESDQVTILDDRSVCAHAAECTDRLPTVFRQGEKPWIDPEGAPAGDIKALIPDCPSGALEYTEPGSTEPVEQPAEPAIKAAVHGPYMLRGGIEVRSADGTPYEVRERQTLCRCGLSSNKPFCDGSHWDNFRDPE